MLNFAIPDPKLAAPMLRVRGDGVGLHVRVIATVNATSLTTAPSIYTVQNASETLQSIAKTVWGDSKLWYLIADANAIGTGTASSPLTAGQLIKLPARINTINNNAQTFKPYNPSKLIGSTTPNLPQVPAVECGGYGQVITTVVAIVVAAVVTILSEDPDAGYSAYTAITAAAAGNVAGQVVGNAIGVQDGFSFKSLALSVVSAGVTQGVAPLDIGTIGRAALGNAITQGIGVVTGLQKSFDWRSVVASGIGAGVGDAVGGALKENGILQGNDFGTSFARGAITGFAAGATTAVARGGRVSVVQVAVDSFGNALGNAIAGNITDNIIADRQTFGATFADDAAARRAQNPLLGRTAADSGGYSVQGDQNAFNDGLTPGQRDFLENSTAGPGVGVGSLRPLDNRALLNAAEKKANPDYYATYPSQKPGQIYSPHLTFGDVGDFLSGEASQAGKAFVNAFTSIPGAISNIIGAVTDPFNSHPLDALERGGLQLQDNGRQAALAARSGNFRPAGELQGNFIGENAAGFVIGAGVSATVSRAVGFYESIPGEIGGITIGDGPSIATDFSKISAIGTNGPSTRLPTILDLFGGKTSQTLGAINVDIVATDGVRASALQLPFKDGIADIVIATNPYIPGGTGMIDFLPEAARVVQPGGQIIVNSTLRNPFGKLPDLQSLADLGLTVIQDRGPLLPQFKNNIFRLTDGRPIPTSSVFTTILQKAKGN
jgi:hypothetical protein